MWAFRRQIPCKPRHPSGGRFTEDSANQGCTRRAADAMFVAEPLVSGQVFRLLETIREYSEERLAGTGETEGLRDGHAEYFCQCLESSWGRTRSSKPDVSPTRTTTYWRR
jgi:hypothetical protein